MAQARNLEPLRLNLTPMTLAETAPQSVSRANTTPGIVAAWRTSEPASHACQLVLHPGEPSELLVQLENISSTPLEIDLQVEGNFPPDWCRIRGEGQQLPPGAKQQAVLYFQLAPDFFESPEAWDIISRQGLDFQGRLSVDYRSIDPGAPPAVFEQLSGATIRLYVRPHSLYTEFIPDLYQQVDFIGRLLHIFEQTFEPAVQTLDAMWAILDPRTAPEALLPFLAHWVGWPLSHHLPLAQQRHLIQQAIQLYRWRGTRQGLRMYLHLFTHLPLDPHLPESEKHIAIEETFCQGLVLGDTRVGEDAMVGGSPPYHFRVRLRPVASQPLDEGLVHQIIQQEKPAFCTYDLLIVPQVAEVADGASFP